MLAGKCLVWTPYYEVEGSSSRWLPVKQVSVFDGTVNRMVKLFPLMFGSLMRFSLQRVDITNLVYSFKVFSKSMFYSVIPLNLLENVKTPTG